jgi:hypothetical protein
VAQEQDLSLVEKWKLSAEMVEKMGRIGLLLHPYMVEDTAHNAKLVADGKTEGFIHSIDPWMWVEITWILKPVSLYIAPPTSW